MTNFRLLEIAKILYQKVPPIRGRERLVSLVDTYVEPTVEPFPVRIQNLLFSLDLSNDTQRFMYYSGEFEPDVSGIIKHVLRRGDVFVDVGANFGFHTILASSILGNTGTVFAFEPLPPAFKQLMENVASNNCPNVVLENSAIGNELGQKDIYTFSNQPDTHASLHASLGMVTNTFTCHQYTLDNYFFSLETLPSIRLIKIDVEGNEQHVLEGSSKLLQVIRPHLIIEINSRTLIAAGSSPETLVNLLTDLSYELSVMTKRGMKSIVPSNISRLAQRHSINIYAAPKTNQ